jgi:O-antigen/teichoic acid export membrane protein
LYTNKIYNIIQRNKELFWNIIGSFGVKGLAMVINILSLPAYLAYFPNQKILGVWFTIISVLNWVLTFDLGIGNGLRNLIVKPLANNDYKKVKEYISTAYVTIGIISLIVGVICSILIKLLDWNNLLNISSKLISSQTLVKSITLILIAVLLQLFLRLIISILYALQKVAVSNLISLISNSVILIFLLTYKNNDASEALILLSVIYITAINIPLIIASFVVFLTYLKKSRPNFRDYKRKYSSSIVKLGLMFLTIQMSLLIINSTNEFIISKFYSPQDVVTYQIYFRIFSVYLILFSLLTIPIWSAITKAYEEGRIQWIKKIYNYLNLVGILFLVLISVTIIFFPDITLFWLGSNTIEIETSTTILIGVYYSIMIFIYAANCIANGLSKLKPQLIINVLAAIIKIPLIIILSKYYNHWNLIIIVNIIIMFPALIIQPIKNIMELNKKELLIKNQK